MNNAQKLNAPLVTQKYQKYIIMFIISIVMLIASIGCFVAGDVAGSVLKVRQPVSFTEAYYYEELDPGSRAYMYVCDEPYLIRYYDDDESYYFVIDDYDNMWILRCTISEEESIVADVNADGYSLVEGTVFALNDEIIGEAMEVLKTQAGMSNITTSDFEEYFGNVALYSGDTIKEASILVLGGVLMVAAVVLFLFCIKGLVSYTTTLSKLPPQTAAAINAELADPSALVVPAVSTYITPSCIVSAGPTLDIVPFANILWMYQNRADHITVWDNEFNQHDICYGSKKTPGIQETYMGIKQTILAKNPQIDTVYDDTKLYQYKNVSNRRKGK